MKIRGFRIELGEIEAALLAHPGVAQAVAAVATGPAGDRRLAAYLRPACDRPEPPASCASTWPGGCPATWSRPTCVVLAPVPLNASGKVDRPRCRRRG